MIVGAVPSGATVPSGAVGNVAPRCCEGRKKKVQAGVRGWTFPAWWAGGMEVSMERGRSIRSRDACPFQSPISVTFWRTPKSVMQLYSCDSPVETQRVQPHPPSVPEEILRCWATSCSPGVIQLGCAECWSLQGWMARAVPGLRSSCGMQPQDCCLC